MYEFINAVLPWIALAVAVAVAVAYSNFDQKNRKGKKNEK